MINIPKRDFRLLMLHKLKFENNVSEISAEHGKRNLHVIAQYEGSSKNSVVLMRVLMMKKVEDEYVALTTNNYRQLLNIILVKVCEKNVSDTWRRNWNSFTPFIEYWKGENINKWVPHELMIFEICLMFSVRYANYYPFFDRIVTCDKKWILYNNHKQSSQYLDRDEFTKQFPKPKFSSAKNYGNSLVVSNRRYPLQLFRNKSKHYCRDLL